LTIDALIVAGDPSRLVLNFPLDIAKVVESPVGDVVKFSPFIASGFAGVSVTRSRRVLGVVIWNVDKLEDEGSSGDDATAAGQEVSSNNVLKYRRLAS